MKKIICAAIRLENGKIYYGHRHSHCIDAANGELSWEMSRKQIMEVKKEQGFVTTEGEFVNRHEAWKIAQAANQIIRNTGGGGTLYSEDIY
jgi:outer membrane protein assembly factor BamB